MSVLTDPGWVVPPLPAGDGGGMDRLRRAVCRFSTGSAHAQRRAEVERALAGVSVSALRAAARHLTLADPSAPLVHLTVLAAALGVDDVVVDLVPPVAAAYLGSESSEAADAAAEELVERVGVARATLLVQSCLPVAALVSSAVQRGVGVDEVLASGTPPVPATKRWSPDTGETVTVPLTGIPFGEGPRCCPAEQHARALAAGVLDALRTG
jgi:hypothetical protein